MYNAEFDDPEMLDKGCFMSFTIFSFVLAEFCHFKIVIHLGVRNKIWVEYRHLNPILLAWRLQFSCQVSQEMPRFFIWCFPGTCSCAHTLVKNSPSLGKSSPAHTLSRSELENKMSKSFCRAQLGEYSQDMPSIHHLAWAMPEWSDHLPSF